MTPGDERAELDRGIRGCQLCKLATTRTKAVPGDGPLGAKLMFVGEAPGFNEDRQGSPFVGAAGKFLEQLLADIDMNRDQVYITNIVKCRPPDNRDPLSDEISACEPYLDEQLRLFNPRVVVTLGRYSMAKFFPGGMISKIHGQPKRDEQRIYYPLYHPAAILRAENLRPIMYDDFRRIPSLLVEAEQMVQKASELTSTPDAETPRQTSMF